jgi:hypothetical protein
MIMDMLTTRKHNYINKTRLLISHGATSNKIKMMKKVKKILILGVQELRPRSNKKSKPSTKRKVNHHSNIYSAQKDSFGSRITPIIASSGAIQVFNFSSKE